MKLSILMAGLATRQRPIEDQIRLQIARSLPHCDTGTETKSISCGTLTRTFPNHYQYIKAEFLSFIDNGELTSGEKRNILTQEAAGDYICFVDDDDEVHPEYVSKLIRACNSYADVISFELQFQNNGVPKEKWKFGLHPNQRKLGLMCVNHLCAWRKPIATLVAWDPKLGYADDRVWFEPLYHAGVIQSNYHINEILYYYKYNSQTTSNQNPERIEYSKQHIGRGLRCFKKHDQLYVETRQPTILYPNNAIVRNKDNEILQIHTPDFLHYHTVKA